MAHAAWARNACVPEPTGRTGASAVVDKIEAHDPHSRMIVPPHGERVAVPAAPPGGRRGTV